MKKVKNKLFIILFIYNLIKLKKLKNTKVVNIFQNKKHKPVCQKY